MRDDAVLCLSKQTTGMNWITLVSETIKQFTRANAKSFGDFDQSVYRGCFFAALNLAYVIVMQVRFFCQSLLADTSSLSTITDRLTQNFAMLLGCHCEERKQERQNRATVFRLYFSACNSWRQAYKQRQLSRVLDLPGFQ